MSHALLLALALAAPPEPTLEQGRRLFHDIDLGVNGRTCAQCHAAGQGLDPEGLRAATARELSSQANRCLAGRMGSPRLDPDSVELRSLVLFLKTFAQKGR